MMKEEQLNQAVMKVWNDQKNIVAMAQSFTGHLQIVLAILVANSGNSKYLSERGRLSFGIRCTFISDLEGEGVVPIT